MIGDATPSRYFTSLHNILPPLRLRLSLKGPRVILMIYKSVAECHQIMCTALDTNVVSYDNVKVWYPKFKNKDYDIGEAKRSGQFTYADKACLQELVEENQYATTRELAKELDISIIFISCINVMYKFNRRLLHELIQAHKDRHVLEYRCKDKIQDQIITFDKN
ncbi:hypothetical protein X975_02217, partial [Stegodyphus mimosarum]